MPWYVYIQRIWVNVAVSFNLNWKDVYYATPDTTKPFVAKAITILLTISTLKVFGKVKEKDIKCLLGDEAWGIAEEYYYFSN